MKLSRILNDRIGRILLLAAIFLMLATIVPPAPLPSVGAPSDEILVAAPVALDEQDPRRRRLGDLIFLRGWVLTSGDRRFGGISAMQVEGGEVTAISDAGTILRFRLPLVAGPQPLRVEPLPRSAATGLEKRDFDTEAMQLHDGRAWIAFERQNMIARYRPGIWRREAAARPLIMRDWSGNSGAEAMVRLDDGRFLLFSEGRIDGGRYSRVALFEGDPALPGTPASALRYRPPARYRVTDAAQLPDGRLLVLNRRVSLFDGASAKLVLAEASDLRAGVVIEGREIAELRSPLAVDNMEALAVTREGGRTIVRIASDDNFMALQRTLLLEFALQEPGQ